MRVVYLTAGAAGMHCGACGRDAGLARALIARGADVQLVPLYTPMTLDTPMPSGTTDTFYGGINVYLQQTFSLFRRMPPALDRLLDARPLLKMASRLGVRTRPAKLGPLTLSMLQGEDGRQRKELQRLLDYLDLQRPIAVVNISNMLLSGMIPALKRRLAVPVACTLQGEDEFVTAIPEPHSSQCRDLMRQHARRVGLFISPSRAYVPKIAEFLAVEPEQIHVVPTGLDLADYPCLPKRHVEPFVIGYLSRITADKGLDLLIDAVGRLRQDGRTVRLQIAGQRLEPAFARDVRNQVRRGGLDQWTTTRSVRTLPEKVRFLHECSAFALPTRRHEVRGTAAMEAMAVGLPVVVPDSGVLPELIGDTGRFFTPGDADGLAAALAELMDHSARADALGLAARERIRVHYSLDQMAASTLALYQALPQETD